MFMELRWSMMALALPSRSEETAKAASLTVPSAAVVLGSCSVLTSSMFLVAVAPGATSMAAVTER